MTARDALHQACYVGMATEVEAEFRINAFRAEVLREAADAVVCDVTLQGPYMDVILHRVADLLHRMADATTTTGKEA